MVVRMRHTSGHTRNRRSHHALHGGVLSVCASCGASRIWHHACAACGAYRGRKVAVIAARREKKEKKAKEKAKEKAK